jgi:hypothetical protein
MHDRPIMPIQFWVSLSIIWTYNQSFKILVVRLCDFILQYKVNWQEF